MLGTLAVLTPNLEHLDICHRLDARCCQIITGSLASLRSLSLHGVSGVTTEEVAAALAALPGSRLTELHPYDSPTFLMDLPASCLPWPHLRELRGNMKLPASIADKVACGLPELRVLEACPEGNWQAEAAGVVFPKLEGVRLDFEDDGFAGVRMHVLMPVLKRLSFQGIRTGADLCGLALTCLSSSS